VDDEAFVVGLVLGKPAGSFGSPQDVGGIEIGTQISKPLANKSWWLLCSSSRFWCIIIG
jgi:hypothetical protein